MSQANAEPGAGGEPSMEDILASIRRILNDDPAPADDAGPVAHQHDAASPVHEDDVFELDHSMIVEEAAEKLLMAPPPPAAVLEPKPEAVLLEPKPEAVLLEPAPMSHPMPDHLEAVEEPMTEHHDPMIAAETVSDMAPEKLGEGAEPLLAPAAAAAASASMGALVRVLGQRQTAVYRGGPSLEDIVRDELRPILKNWLDENLAPMVERSVRAEIERLTRNGL